jgi:hypothetical protein
VSEQPVRGGAWDFGGRVRPEYSPRRDGDPDPGEVVWAWVPYEEDPAVGKDRPLLVIGHDVTDSAVLVGLMLSSQDHGGDRGWFPVGAGPWDREDRPSWVRLDRPLAVRAGAVRREGAALPAETFLAVVERAVAAPRPRRATSAPTPAPARPGLLSRLRGVFRRR